jgi:hypothetical protein
MSNVWIVAIVSLSFAALLVGASVRSARKQKLESAELGRIAREGLLKLNLSPEELAHDTKVIDGYVRTGSNPHDQIVLRNFAAHTERHRVEDIEATSIGAILAGVPNPSQLTDEHIIVHRSIEDALMYTGIFTSGAEGSETDEHLAVSDYALHNIEEGQLILTLIYERRCGTLKQVMDALPMMKNRGTSALASGAL